MADQNTAAGDPEEILANLANIQIRLANLSQAFELLMGSLMDAGIVEVIGAAADAEDPKQETH